MSILDNILPAPDYGVKYQLTYINRTGNVVRLRIWERDHNGIPWGSEEVESEPETESLESEPEIIEE